jgi:hypothetical protein
MAMANTVVSITGPDFLINGNRTYGRRTYNGMRIEGLLFNSRMVQGIFDDLNPETRRFWDYPDGPWDPERNTREFVSAMPDPNKPFYSHRHTATSYLRNTLLPDGFPAVKEDVERYLTGHARKGAHAGYGKQWIETLKAAIEVIPNPFGDENR